MKTTTFKRVLSLLACMVLLTSVLCFVPETVQAYDLEDDYVLLDIDFVAASF